MWSFYTTICLTGGHNEKPIFCSCHSWFDICVMEQKQWDRFGLGDYWYLLLLPHVSEKEGDGPGLAIQDKLISQFLLAQIRKIRKNMLKLVPREEER